MPHRSRLAVLVFIAAAVFWIGMPKAASQLVEKKQALVIGYPTTGIVVSDKVPIYKGTIYVKVYPVTPGGNSGAGPVVTAELQPSHRSVSQLPLGVYEVHYAMRTGGELTTLIHRDVTLRADQAVSMVVEMNADAKTTIVGGDWTAQRMTESIKALQAEVAALKKELADLRRK